MKLAVIDYWKSFQSFPNQILQYTFLEKQLVVDSKNIILILPTHHLSILSLVSKVIFKEVSSRWCRWPKEDFEH